MRFPLVISADFSILSLDFECPAGFHFHGPGKEDLQQSLPCYKLTGKAGGCAHASSEGSVLQEAPPDRERQRGTPRPGLQGRQPADMLTCRRPLCGSDRHRLPC